MIGPAGGAHVPAPSRLRFEVAPVPEPIGGFQVLVFVDDVEVTALGAGLEMDPYDVFVPRNRLVAGDRPPRPAGVPGVVPDRRRLPGLRRRPVGDRTPDELAAAVAKTLGRHPKRWPATWHASRREITGPPSVAEGRWQRERW
jgi:hypothetical protein